MLEELKKYADELYTCNRSHCGFCQEGCPAYRVLGYEQYSSRGRNLIARALIEGKARIDESVVDSAFSCFLCGFCNARCALYPTNIFIALRREIKKANMTPQNLIKVASNILSSGNPYAFSPSDRTSWFKGVETSRSEILYFPGCVYSYIYPKRTKNIYDLLKKSGYNIYYNPEVDFCCGYPAYIIGDFETFQEIAKRNYKKWKEMGIKKIFTPCPGCFKAIGEHYPEFIDSFDIEVEHVVLGVYRAYDNGQLKLDKKFGIVTYHDPCELTRFMRVVEEPRKLIEAISKEFIELDHNKYFARCCGGGGMVSAYNPKLSMMASIDRANEINQSNAEIVTTFCPTCERTLSKGLKKTKSKVKLMSLGDMLLESLS